ncbi:MAG: alpha/beta hydrolase [Anaerolineales bacterium]|nr:alpha/beta hydrolase [Anaerolineales bacterium]
MDHTSSTFFTGPGEQEIYSQSWLPEGNLRGCLLILHGLGEHSGRYYNLIDYLVPEGFGLYGFDFPGHGRSEGTPGHIASVEDFFPPVQRAAAEIVKRHPSIPLFLWGHSMGGLLAIKYIQDQQTPFRGVILSSPSLSTPQSANPLTVLLGNIFSHFFPRFPLSALDHSQLSRDPAVVEDYREDPLVYQGKYSARLAVELLKTIAQVKSRAADFTHPVLLLIGGADQISLAPDTLEFAEDLGSVDKTVLIFKEFQHELINEPGKEQVLDKVLTWLNERLREGAPG